MRALVDRGMELLLADALVLSCEVGAAKPSALIFERALEALPWG